MVAADGYTYERLAITEWVSRSPTSPLTNMRLEHTQVRAATGPARLLSTGSCVDALPAPPIF